MLERITKTLLCLLALFPILCFAHGSAEIHCDDFTGIFNGYGDDTFQELAKRINSGIDAYSFELEIKDSSGKVIETIHKKGLPGLFKEHLGSVPGNHRILGHGWALNDDIPKQTLDYLSKFYPGREKEIIDVWRTFANEINSEAVRLTGLPPKQAKAYASLLYNIHLLGDLEPDNTLIDLVLPRERIARNIEREVEILFKNDPNYVAFVKKRIASAMRRGGSDQKAAAEALMTELYSLRMGTKQNAVWGKSFKPQYSIERAVAANTRRAERVARPVAKIPGMKRIPKSAADFAKMQGVKFRRGILQEHHINGKTVRTLSIPVSPLDAGASAGVITLIFTEGVTIYKFTRGSITEDEFIKESAKNCGGAILVGTTTYVLVALGATPTGWVVIGVGIAAELVYDVAFECVYKEFARPTISMQDILGRLPTELQRRTSVFDERGFGSFMKYHKEKISSLEFTNHAESPFEYITQDISPLEPYSKKQSPLEIGVE